MSHKVSYAYKIIYSVINEFIPHEVRGNFHISDHSIGIFGIRYICLEFSNTPHVDSLYRLRKSVVDKVKTEVCIKKYISFKENNMKIQYTNKFSQKMGIGDPKTCVYQFIYDESYSDDTKIIQYFIMNVLGLCIKVDIYVAHMFYSWPFSHNTAVTIAINKNKYFPSLNSNTAVFDWGAGNSNKNRT